MTDTSRRRGAAPDSAAADGPDQAALDRLAREVEKRVEQAPRADSMSEKARLEQLRAEQERVKAALAEQEAALTRRTEDASQDAALLNSRAPEAKGWLARLRRGISKTRDNLAQGLSKLVLGHGISEPQLLTELEDVLLAADVGPKTAARLMAAVKERIRRKELEDGARLQAVLREEILRIMSRQYPASRLDTLPASEGPGVVMFVGVNGSGKTTSIGKLAAQYRAQGKSVLLVAGDTFRAAASEQLVQWGERTGTPVFTKPAGSDPSGVLYQGLQQGIAEKADLVLCDTAGRLHTKANLMEELKKMKRVLGKLLPAAPHETWLVVDGNNGQNALQQAREYRDALEITGLVVTKLDGTARGGVIIGIVNEFDLPIRFVGIGEGVEDLRPFDPRQFAESLFEETPAS